MFCEEMLDLFHRIPVALPKPVGYINKQQILLTDIGGKWFMDKHKSKLHSNSKSKTEKGRK